MHDTFSRRRNDSRGFILDDITPYESQPAAPPPETAGNPLPFRRPADYYATPEVTLRPIVPRWVPIGCGWASLVFVILLFVVGALAPRSGSFMGWVFGKIQDDMTPQFTADVTLRQKAAFAAEMKTLRASANGGRLKLEKTQKFLKLVTEVGADEKIDHAEADRLIGTLRDVNGSPR